MSEPVPVDNIKWVDQQVVDSWTQENIIALNANDSYSYIMELE